MNQWTIYRLALPLLPARGRVTRADDAEQGRKLEKILRRYRCVGATVCRFTETEIETYVFGSCRKDGTLAEADTVYRIASVSKYATGLCAMRLQELGVIDLDADVQRYFPISLRHPGAPDTSITLRMLMTHTAAIHDGVTYNAGIGKGEALSSILAGDSFCTHLPGERWEYSNLGAGIAGAVLESAAGMDFEALMQQMVFEPLGVQATFYPGKVPGMVADAVRILPPSKTVAMSGASRQKQPVPTPCVDPEHHYVFAHGNLYISAPELCKLGWAGMTPGFLTAESLKEMRHILCPFGERANNLSQGVGTFVLEDAAIYPRPLYGHQGMAYGAVHGLFFDPETGRGLSVLTTGASEARRGVLSDLNGDLLRWAMENC